MKCVVSSYFDKSVYLLYNSQSLQFIENSTFSSLKYSCSLKQIFAQCKIILEGALIVNNLKMINKMLTLSPLEIFLRTPMNDRGFSLSFFRHFRAFTHYELFVSFHSLISVSK